MAPAACRAAQQGAPVWAGRRAGGACGGTACASAVATARGPAGTLSPLPPRLVLCRSWRRTACPRLLTLWAASHRWAQASHAALRGEAAPLRHGLLQRSRDHSRPWASAMEPGKRWPARTPDPQPSVCNPSASSGCRCSPAGHAGCQRRRRRPAGCTVDPPAAAPWPRMSNGGKACIAKHYERCTELQAGAYDGRPASVHVACGPPDPRLPAVPGALTLSIPSAFFLHSLSLSLPLPLPCVCAVAHMCNEVVYRGWLIARERSMHGGQMLLWYR